MRKCLVFVVDMTVSNEKPPPHSAVVNQIRGKQELQLPIDPSGAWKHFGFLCQEVRKEKKSDGKQKNSMQTLLGLARLSTPAVKSTPYRRNAHIKMVASNVQIIHAKPF